MKAKVWKVDDGEDSKTPYIKSDHCSNNLTCVNLAPNASRRLTSDPGGAFPALQQLHRGTRHPRLHHGNFH